MTPDQRRKVAQNLSEPLIGSSHPTESDPYRYLREDPSAGQSASNEQTDVQLNTAGTGAAIIDSCRNCIRNVIESHEVYLAAIQEDLANYQGILRVLLERLASNPGDPAITAAIDSVENQIANRERDEELQSARLSGASDCSGC